MRAPYPSLWDRLIAQVILDADCWTWIGPTRRHGGGHRPAVTMRVAGVANPRHLATVYAIALWGDIL